LHGATHDSQSNPLWFLEGPLEEDVVEEDDKVLDMKGMGLNDIDDMYLELDAFIIEEFDSKPEAFCR